MKDLSYLNKRPEQEMDADYFERVARTFLHPMFSRLAASDDVPLLAMLLERIAARAKTDNLDV